MIKSKKQMFITIVMFTLLFFLSATTYAFFNYTRTGSPNNFSVGRINFKSDSEETINLSNVFPINPDEPGIMDDFTKVGIYELTIQGDTDYADGLEYLVSLVDVNIYTSTGKAVPISLDISVNNLGIPEDNYYTEREDKDTTMYRKLINGPLVGDQLLLVGFIKPNTVQGEVDGVNGSITIKAYVDESNILITDTYEEIVSNNTGSPNSLIDGKVIFSTSEWNNLHLSFKVRVEANKGIWVHESLEDIMRRTATLDNINSTYVQNETPGIDFQSPLSDTNGKGVYLRANTVNDLYPVAYYRGKVDDNNVLFANLCWKAIRTTELGGVKLLYNGQPSYTYGTHIESDKYLNITKQDVQDIYNEFTFDNSDNSWNLETTGNSLADMDFKVVAGSNYILSINSTITNVDAEVGEYIILKNDEEVKRGRLSASAGFNISYSFGALSSDDKISIRIRNGTRTVSYVRTIKVKMMNNSTALSESDYTIINKKIQISKKISFDNNEKSWNAVVKNGDTLKFEFDVPQNDYYAISYRYTSPLTNENYAASATLKIYQSSTELFNKTIYSYNNATISDTIKMGNVGSDNHISVELNTRTMSGSLIEFYIIEPINEDLGCDNNGNNTFIQVEENGESTSLFYFNEFTNSLADSGYMYGEINAPQVGMEDGSYYASTVSYNNGVYTLDGDVSQTRGGQRHYSCGANLMSCSTVRYYTGQGESYYALSNGDLIMDMINKAQENIHDSIAKEKIDTWYSLNLINYTNKLEDTIWCNARYRDTLNGGMSEVYYSNVHGESSYSWDGYFTHVNYDSNPIFQCSSKNDSFTVNNTNGNTKLTYPIGLLTHMETMIMGFSSGEGGTYYTMTPFNTCTDSSSSSSSCYTMFSIGGRYLSSDIKYGLRPAISIKPGQFIRSGTGTVTDPYVIG